MAELSGIDMVPLVREIDEKLRGSYVNNVFSVGTNQLVRFRRPGGEESWLVLSPRYGCWLSEKVSARTDTTEFTSRLRSEVERSRFAGAAQYDLDRVFDLSLRSGDSLRHLIVELMPPGNIAATDADGTIRLLLREMKSGRRQLRRGAKYVPPAQGRLGPLAVTPQSVREFLGKEKTLGGALGRHIAMPRKYLKEVLWRLGMDETSQAGEALGKTDEITQAIKGIVDEAERTPNPCIAETDGEAELFAVLPKSSKVTRQASSMSELCDELFTDSVFREATEVPTPEDIWRKEREVTTNRLRAKEQELLDRAQKLRDAAGRAGRSSSLTDAIEILKGAAGAAERSGAEPKSREAVASALFAMAKETERKAGEARSAAETLSRKKAPKMAPGKVSTRELKKRRGDWYEKFRWFFTSGGKLAIGGRDAQSNGLLIRRHLEDGDTVYHADLFGSPFFVLKRGTEQTAAEVLEVAQATVAFSSAWKTGLGAADAYWVGRDQIGTSAPSGEFLARGSFMVRGKKNLIQRNLVQVAVGLDARGRVVAGPEGALSTSASSLVVMVPHREKASETAKKVAHELRRMEGGPGPSVDEVLRALPAGGGKIVRTKSARTKDKPK